MFQWKHFSELFSVSLLDSNFSWANAGATLFGAAAPAKAEGGEEGSDEEDTNNVGIDFEPIVSLPEVLIIALLLICLHLPLLGMSSL